MKTLFLEIKEKKLTIPLYYSLLNLKMVKDDSNVVELFLQLKANLESQPEYDEFYYFAFLCIFSKLEQSDIVRSILEDIKLKGIKPHRLYYTTLINHYARLYDPIRAKSTFHEMKKAGFKPSIYTYNTLLSAYFYSNSLTAESDVISLINEMELDGIPQNAVYFSTLLGFYINQVPTLKLKGELFEKQMQQIYDLVKQLKQQQMLNLRSYNHILSLYLYLNDSESAISFFGEMIEDKDVVPNIYTYTILMFIFARSKNLESTMSIYNQMLSQGIQPDAATYTALIELHLALKNEAEALNILDEMKSKNIQPEYPIYSLITSYFAEKDDPAQLLYHHLRLKKLMRE
jgi:pentatricopeptide repeat protein